MGVLERLEETRGLPEAITVDNGPEFAGKAMEEWASADDGGKPSSALTQSM